MNQTYARRKIKAEAQLLLNGNWLKAFLLLITETLFTMIIFSVLPLRTPAPEEIAKAEQDIRQLIMLFLPNGLNIKVIASFGVVGLLGLFVLSPFSVGVSRFFLGVARGAKPKIREVFAVYASLKTVFASIWLQVLLFLVSSFWTMIFMIIPVAITFAGAFLGSVALVSLGAIITSVVSVFTFLWNSRYTFARFIFAEGKMGAFASLRECIELIHGRTKECIVLRISYFFWDIMSGYIPVLMFPYFALSNTVYAKYLYYLRGETSFSDEIPNASV